MVGFVAGLGKGSKAEQSLLGKATGRKEATYFEEVDPAMCLVFGCSHDTEKRNKNQTQNVCVTKLRFTGPFHISGI